MSKLRFMTIDGYDLPNQFYEDFDKLFNCYINEHKEMDIGMYERCCHFKNFIDGATARKNKDGTLTIRIIYGFRYRS